MNNVLARASCSTRTTSETSMMRFLGKRLAEQELRARPRNDSRSGSCTMKLISRHRTEAVAWREYRRDHRLRADDGRPGIPPPRISQLEEWLTELTGYDAIGLQPNAGSQGELADRCVGGLIAAACRAGDHHRDTCLIPSSAHGTNAASASARWNEGCGSCSAETTGMSTLTTFEPKSLSTATISGGSSCVTDPSSSTGVYEHGIRGDHQCRSRSRRSGLHRRR